MSERRAIVVGHRGQDGRLLVGALTRAGVAVLGVGRTETIAYGNIPNASCRVDVPESVADAVRATAPDEIYYLAAHHASSQATRAGDPAVHYRAHLAVNVAGPLAFLDAIRRHAPRCRFFFASSSLVFGNAPRESPQTETTPPAPEEPYAAAKLLTSMACRDYRRAGVFASVGILFNHESALRPPTFLSAKIVRAALAAQRGETPDLVLGDLDATVDWGYAPDFVDAFRKILTAPEPDDFVVATGEAHTVRDFLDAAFCGPSWKNCVRVDPATLARARSGRVGDASKLRRVTGWRPSLTFVDMVRRLVADAEAAQMAGVP